MKQEQLIAAAKTAAETHKLVPELVCAVIEQESNWDTWLNRYEPEFENSHIYGPKVQSEAHEFSATCLEKYYYETTWETEVKNRCTSWGLLQVMGQVAREIGFKNAIPSMCDIPVGLELGCSELAIHVARADGDLTRALESYNGGADPEYASKVFARVNKYK